MSSRRGPARVLAVCVLAACATAPPVVRSRRTQIHVVRRGETLWSISQRYGASVDAVALANGISDPERIQVGQRLAVPAGIRVSLRRPGDRWARRDPRGRPLRVQLAWPVRGRVSSRFGMRHGAHHDGIDIAAREGTRIRAVAAGRVVHADDSLSGYGNLIIIKHAGSLSSVYAHNRRNLVKAGAFVEKGEVIAEVGSTGRATAPHLHLEIRLGGKAVDPLHYLQ